MSTRFNKVHPALKHAGYSATTLLPGEDSAAFEALHRALIAEFTPIGALEQDIVADIARLTWRKQNLATFRIAELAKERHQKIQYEKVPGTPLLLLDDIDPAAAREGYRAAEKQARQELGDIYQLIDIGEPATIEGLMKELDLKERLDGLISKMSQTIANGPGRQVPLALRGRCRKFQAPEKQADTKVRHIARVTRCGRKQAGIVMIAGAHARSLRDHHEKGYRGSEQGLQLRGYAP